MKSIQQNTYLKRLILLSLMASCIPWDMNAQAKPITPIQPISLSKKEITRKVELLNSAIKTMNSAKTRMIAEIAARITLGAAGGIALTIAIAAATGGIGAAVIGILGTTTTISAEVLLSLGVGTIVASIIAGGTTLAVNTTAGLARVIGISIIFKTLGEAIINKKPLAFLLFTLPTRNAVRKLEGLDNLEKELNELITLERSAPGALDKKQQKIVETYYKKLKDPFYVGIFRAFAEKSVWINIIRKAIELDSSLRAIIKNDPEKTAKLIAKYIVLNRNFGNYMAALNELTYDKKKREIFRLRGLARTKVSLQFKATQKQIAKIERKYPQLTRLKNELVGMYRKESSALDKKYAEMLKK